jgi:sugar lactone lactonase YvrE
MALRKSTLFLVSTCCALALGADCSGGAPPASTPGLATPVVRGAQSHVRHGWISPTAKKEKLLYVSDYTSSVILIYQQGNTGSGPIGEIVDGVANPEGIAVDAVGTLYVANIGNSTVTEYPAGSTSPSVTLSTGISRPLDVSVDSTGIVYVTEGSAGMVLEFKPGSTFPDATVSIMHPSDATNSRNDDVYVTNNQSSTGHVMRCKPLSTKCKDLGIAVQFAQGIAIDSRANLLVGDVFGEVIDIYAHGKTTPFRTIVVTNEQPSKLALDTKDKTLYMADPANFAVRLFDYANGNETSSFTFGSADELEGVALFPGQKPGK